MVTVSSTTRTTKSLFVGAWALVNITLSQNGKSMLDNTFGPDPRGTISYSSSGLVSALITPSDPALAPESLQLPVNANQSDELWATVGKNILGYSGPYTINETAKVDDRTGVVIHGPLRVATLSSYVGGSQIRTYSFSEDGNYLSLGADFGNGVVDTLLWQRL